jgi:hypothetical protein
MKIEREVESFLEPDGESRASSRPTDGGFGIAICSNKSPCPGKPCAAPVPDWCRSCEFCEFVNNFFGRFLSAAGIFAKMTARQGNRFAA